MLLNALSGFGAGKGAFGVDAVNFDGSTDLVSTQSGLSDTMKITISVWFKSTQGTAYMLHGGKKSGGHFSWRLEWTGGGSFSFSAYDPSGSFVFNWRILHPHGLDDGVWHHFLASVDADSSATRHVYIDDAIPAGGSWNTWAEDTDINMSLSPEWRVAELNTGNEYEGDMAEFWFEPDYYIDLSVVGNRRKWIDAGGKPVDLGSNGEAPKGTSPLIFLTGLFSSWHLNKGTGSDYGVADGALTAATTSPSD